MKKWILWTLIIAATLLVGCGVSEEEQAKRVEDRRKGFHCLSAWDGHHNGLEELVKVQLNDPNSMETFETKITPVDGITDKHTVIMEFGARNAFGGMVRNTAVALVDNGTCEAELLTIN